VDGMSTYLKTNYGIIEFPDKKYHKLSGSFDWDDYMIEFEVLWFTDKVDEKDEIIFYAVRDPEYTDYNDNKIKIDFETIKDDLIEDLRLEYEDTLIRMCSRPTDLETFETYADDIYYL
jgi:hypothetical protein